MLIATIVITFGWLVTLLNQDVDLISDRVGDPRASSSPQRSALIFGFLGAYFFALQLIQRGYARGDLRPKTYTQITVRILMVTILAMVLELLPGADDEPYILVLAFAAGIVPETALVGIQEYLNRELGRRRVRPRRSPSRSRSRTSRGSTCTTAPGSSTRASRTSRGSPTTT